MVCHLADALSLTDVQPVAEQIEQLPTAAGNMLVANVDVRTPTSLSHKGPEVFLGY